MTTPDAPSGALPPEELAHRVALAHVRGVGPVAWSRLAKAFGTAAGAWRASEGALTVALGARPAAEIVEARRTTEPMACLARVEACGAVALTPEDPRYPAGLRTLGDPPFVLFVQGAPAVLAAPCIAIVGTRKPSPDGGRAARRLAGDIAVMGVTVVSGMALGIDAEAHRAALEVRGVTVAVLGCGIGAAYPRRHAHLMSRIAASGAVVSEYPPGRAAVRANFPLRNRIIAGLACATVVVEAGQPSGALITAMAALDEGRPVCAVPGSIFNEMAMGTLALLRQGATPVGSARQVLEEAGLVALVGRDDVGADEDDALGGMPPDARRVLTALGAGGRSPDDLASALGLTPAAVARGLTALELAGLARPQAGSTWVATR